MERLDVVGMPAGGWSELGETARQVIAAAEVLLGGRRHLDLVPDNASTRDRIWWPSPLRPALPGLLERYAGRRVVVLASGDPRGSGIGTTLIELLGPAAVRIHPAVSSVALARARMGWPSEDVTVVTVVGRDLGLVRRHLGPDRRLVVLSSGSDTPTELAQLLVDAGYGPSVLTVHADLGTEAETRSRVRADDAVTQRSLVDAPRLNLVAVECRSAAGTRPLGPGPGLPDDVFDSDGQLTKRDLRASALARLAPIPGELLWDLGAGAGSIAIEWARTDPHCRAIAVDRVPDRSARITANAARLGVPDLRVITADVSTTIEWLPRPAAIFIGGGAENDLIRRCWHLLPPGGRLVVHAVTVETEQVVLRAWRAFGGELIRIGVERMESLGGFHGWKPARAVVQWAAVRGADGASS
ncbi:MAG: precorrin-6y C5,15-methyltransferase (decarboxylating) subunit CbiE [Microlunatus sp.]|nr:precorrin-6y C5,15-methyltransferase (decarboxylating) subunit CbiE [Microlunatus sp.]